MLQYAPYQIQMEGGVSMPVRERTSHEIPTPKKSEGGIFKNHGAAPSPPFVGETEVRHRAGLNYATGNSNKQNHVGGKKTLTR